MIASTHINPHNRKFIKIFCDYLVSTGTLDKAAVARAIAAQTQSGERIDLVLPRLGLLTESEMSLILARHLDLPVFTRKDMPQTPVVAAQLKPQFLKANLLIPLEITQGKLILATADPFASQKVEMISYMLDKEVQLGVISQSDFFWAFNELYQQSEVVEVGFASNDVSENDIQRLRDLASEAPTIKLVNELLDDAIEHRASDVHIEPFEDTLRVRYRIDGQLVTLRVLPATKSSAVVSRIKVIAKLDIAERRMPHDGRAKISLRGSEIDLRVSTIPTIYGESVVIRILNKGATELDFQSLGFSFDLRSQFAAAFEASNGIVLVTGPTGSGKTTTLYATMSALNEVRRKIISVEDPVEYNLSGINQIQIQPAIGLDFASVLRSILRQDPDVIMVGEIRDLETAKIAVQASLTGHMVLSTVHTNDAISSIPRLLDLGIESFLLASTLRAVIAQRLVRKLCISCASPDPSVTAQFAAIAKLANVKVPDEFIPLGSVGCERCRNTGFFGRTTILEFLEINDKIQKLIRSQAGESEIEHVALKNGMRMLVQDGLDKVIAGETSLSEILDTVQVQK